MALDIILATDGLTLPLTGIGRYTYELTKRLRDHQEVIKLRYFSMGRWVKDPLSGLEQSYHGGATLRSVMAANRVAVQVYQLITPTIYRWRLRGNKHSIYHSPNYVMPPFQGATVSTVHDLSHILYPHFHPPARVEFLNAAFGVSMSRTRHVIVDTAAVRGEFLARFNWAPERVSVVGLGVDPIYHPRGEDEKRLTLAKWNLRDNGYTLYVGTIEPRKNLERLLLAYSQLPKELRQSYPLVIVGARGWKSETIHRKIASAQMEGWLHYLSFVDQSYLPILYAGAKLFVYPSLYEGFGLPIVEAMASGTPVLTSNTSCMPEVARGAARLVNPLDVEDISYSVAYCLEDSVWLKKARTLGLARAAMCSWDRCVEETVGVYKAIQ